MKKILALSAAAIAASCASAPQPKPTALEQGKQQTREDIVASMVEALKEKQLGVNPDGAYVFCFENFGRDTRTNPGVIMKGMLETSVRVAKIRALSEKCASQGQNEEGARGCLPGPDDSVKGNTVTVSFDCVDSKRDVSCTSSDVDATAVVMPAPYMDGKFVSCAKATVNDFEQTGGQSDDETSGDESLDPETARLQEEIREIEDDIETLKKIGEAMDELGKFPSPPPPLPDELIPEEDD